MMRSYESFLALLAELDGDVAELERQARHNRKAWERIEQGADDSIDWGSLGFTIHSMYGEDLDPGKTAVVQGIATALLGRFPELHKKFRAELMAIGEKLLAHFA